MCLCVCTSLLPSIIAFLQVYYCISDAHRSKGCFSCIVCFAFLFLPLLRLSLTVSPWSLAWSHSTSCCTHTHYTVHEWKSCNKLLKPTFCSTLLLFCPSIRLPCPYHLPFLQLCLALCFSITLSHPLNHCPHVFSYYLHLLPAPLSPPIFVCKAGWLLVLTWEGLTFRGRSPACSTDISARLWWCLWTKMCGGKSCLSLCLPAALALRLHRLEWDVLYWVALFSCTHSWIELSMCLNLFT